MEAVSLFGIMAESWLKASLLLVLGLFFAWLLRKSPAETGHRVLLLLMAIVLLLPLVLWMLPRWEVLPRSGSSPVLPGPAPASSELITFEKAPYEIIPPSSSAGTRSGRDLPARNWRDYWLIAWGLGLVCLLGKLLTGAIRLSRLVRHRVPISPELISQVNRLREESGFSREVRLILDPEVNTPFAWDFGTPSIALPDSATNWSSDRADMVLRHELEHLARGDGWSALITGMAIAVHWFNPLAWIAARRISQLREEICDLAVLRSGCNAKSYADLLFQQARSKSIPFPLSATAMAKPGTLERRVKMILTHTPRLSPPPLSHSSPSRKLRMALTGLLAIAGAIAITLAGFTSRTALAGDTGNTTLTIHVYGVQNGKQELGYELNDKPVEAANLPDALRDEAKLNSVLALAPAAPVSMKGVTHALKMAEEAGFSHIIFAKRNIKNSAGHGDSDEAIGSEGPPPSLESHPALAMQPGSSSAEPPSEDEIPALMSKVNAIRLPSVEFSETPLADVLEFLAQRSVELDPASDPAEKGVNFVLDYENNLEEAKVSLTLNNVSLAQILKSAARQTNTLVRVDEHAVLLQSRHPNLPLAHPALGADPDAKKVVEAKLNQIRLPSVEFTDTPLRDAIAFLAQRSIELDNTASNPEERGVNMAAWTALEALDTPITLRLNNIPLGDALRYATNLANMEYHVEGNVVVISPEPSPDSGSEFGFGFDAGGFGGGTGGVGPARR